MGRSDHRDEKGDDVGHSEDRKDFWGNDYQQHHDRTGEKTGRSRPTEGLFGDKFTEELDPTGERVGISRAEKDLFTQDEHIQRYNNRGDKIGRSQEEEGLFGDRFTQHYDAHDEKTGRTRVNQEALRREEREQRSREQLAQATRAYHSDGALKLKNLKNVAWGPTLKLAFWRGVASAPGFAVLTALFANGGILERLLFAIGAGVVWALGAWYAAPITYIFFRAIGAVLGPLTMGIFYLVANINLLILAFIVSLGDPIIAYIHRRSPHFFQIDDYPLFSMKSMIFIVNSSEPSFRRSAPPMRQERDYEPERQPEPAPSASSFEPVAQSWSEEEQHAHAFAETESTAQAAEPRRAGAPIGLLIFGGVLLAAIAIFVLLIPRTAQPPQQSVVYQPSAPAAPLASPAVTPGDQLANIVTRVWVAPDFVHVPDADVRQYPGPVSQVALYMQLDNLARDDLVAARLLRGGSVVSECPDSTHLQGGRNQYWCAPQQLSEGAYRYEVTINGTLVGTYAFVVGSPASERVQTQAATQAPSSPIDGHWHGQFWREGRRPTDFEMSMSGKGSAADDGSVEITGTAQDAAILIGTRNPLSGAYRADRTIVFTRTYVLGAASYTGILSADGQTITGQWTRGRSSGEFRLERDADK